MTHLLVPKSPCLKKVRGLRLWIGTSTFKQLFLIVTPKPTKNRWMTTEQYKNKFNTQGSWIYNIFSIITPHTTFLISANPKFYSSFCVKIGGNNFNWITFKRYAQVLEGFLQIVAYTAANAICNRWGKKKAGM